MNKNKTETGKSYLLLTASIVLMVASLYLPSIYNKTGFEVLMVGLPYGFITPLGWPVYANVFYLYAVIRYNHYPVVSTSFMLFLFLLTPAGTATVTTWGWGAVLWGIAILLLVLAVFLQPKKLKKTTEAIVLVITLLLTLFPAIYLHNKQINLASHAEKEEYFSFGTAFTTKPLTGLDRVSMRHLTIDSIDNDAVIEIIGRVDSDKKIVSDGNFSIEIPHYYQHNGRFIRIFQAKGLYPIRLIRSRKPVDYYYGIKKLEDNLAEIYLLDKEKNPIWKGKVKHIKNTEKSIYSHWKFAKERLSPDYYYELDSFILHNYYKTAVQYNADTNLYYVNGRVLTAESTSRICASPTKQQGMGAYTIFEWYGEQIEIDTDYGKLERHTFCSENYRFLFTRWSPRGLKTRMYVLVFDKLSMFPLYGFKAFEDDSDEPIQNLLRGNIEEIKEITFVPARQVSKRELEPEKIQFRTQDEQVMTLVNGHRF